MPTELLTSIVPFRTLCASTTKPRKGGEVHAGTYSSPYNGHNAPYGYGVPAEDSGEVLPPGLAFESVHLNENLTQDA